MKCLRNIDDNGEGSETEKTLTITISPIVATAPVVGEESKIGSLIRLATNRQV